MDTSWLDGIDAAVTVCDREGIILSLNERAIRMFREEGGSSLVGKSLFDCHPEKASEQIRRMLKEETSNTYTIEKNGKKKLIWQTPWRKDGQFAGLVEIAIPLPFDVPHFVRKP